MADLTVSRKQRLRTLESQIRQNYEAFVATGFALKEIRDDLLYKEDGFETWDAYLKERVGEQFGIEQAHVYRLIACAQVRPKLPEPFSPTGEKEGWSQSALLEFGRLAPKDRESRGHPHDYDRLDRRDVQRVAKKVIEHCEQEGTKPTAPVVRKFVDAELGVDRAAQAQETKRQRQEDGRPLLHRFLDDMLGRLEGEKDLLEGNVTDDDWKQLAKSHPGLIRRLIAACDSLADRFRKVAR